LECKSPVLVSVELQDKGSAWASPRGVVGINRASFIPIVGRIISHTPGVDTFIQGLVIFRVFSGGFIECLLERADIHVANLYPGFWASVGYLVLAMVLV
jgi:hypothetical protein